MNGSEEKRQTLKHGVCQPAESHRQVHQLLDGFGPNLDQ
jgi:hypothetical protein